MHTLTRTHTHAHTYTHAHTCMHAHHPHTLTSTVHCINTTQWCVCATVTLCKHSVFFSPLQRDDFDLLWVFKLLCTKTNTWRAETLFKHTHAHTYTTQHNHIEVQYLFISWSKKKKSACVEAVLDFCSDVWYRVTSVIHFALGGLSIIIKFI